MIKGTIMTQLKNKKLRPDSKGRVTLGSLAKGVTGFEVTIDDQNRIILDPLVEVPAREKWLFDNEVALNQVKKGLQDAAAGKVNTRDFSKYLDDDD